MMAESVGNIKNKIKIKLEIAPRSIHLYVMRSQFCVAAFCLIRNSFLPLYIIAD